MNIKVTIDAAKLDALLRDMPSRIDDVLDGIAQEMVTDIQLSFNTSPPGKTYKRGRKTHTASVAGSPPNVDLGTLRASMRWRRSGPQAREISDGVEYGIMLEDGSESMGARPFVGPVFADWGGKIEPELRRRLNLE